MKLSVCLVCLKTFDGEDLTSEEDGTPCGVPLFTRFLKFAENYLQVSMQQLLLNGGGKGAFCEKCELSVINPICQVYLELLSAKLRLSSELERLGKLLDNSKVSGSDKLRVVNINALSYQLGIRSLSQLEGFRTSLAQKCRLKRKEALPNLLLTSQCGEDQTSMMEVENDEFPFHHNLESQKVEVDPLALESANDNAFEVKVNLSSIERQNGEGEAPGKIGSVMKVETLHQDSSPEPLFKNATNDDIEDSPSELRELEEIPVAKRAGTRIKGLLYYGYRCPTCSKVLNSKSQYHIHYRYHHQHVSCTFCGKAFRGNKLLHIHVTRLHQRQGVFTCNICSKVFNTAYRLDNHLGRMHPSKEQMHHCLQCEVSFRAEHNLKQHVDTIHSPGIYPCPHCPPGAQRFSTSKYLSTHIKLRHHADGRQS